VYAPQTRTFWPGNSMGRDHLGVPEVDEIILLKCHSKEICGREWVGSRNTWDMWQVWLWTYVTFPYLKFLISRKISTT